MARETVEKFTLEQFGGLCERPGRLPYQSPDCRNVIARRKNLLEKRLGQEYLNTAAMAGACNGAHAYYNGVTRVLVACGGGSVYSVNTETGAVTAIKTGISATARVQMATCANYMVGFDGVTLPWKYNGTAVTSLANAPSDGYLALLYMEKLITVSKADPSTLLWSDSFYPEVWPVINYWPVGDGDGDEIRAYIPFGYQKHLAVFKRRSIWALYGTEIGNMEMGPANEKEHGAVGPNAVVEHGGCLYYVSDTGIYRYNGIQAVCLTDDLPDLWARVSKDSLDGACAGAFGTLLRFSLPFDDSATNNLELIFDPQTGEWWPMDAKAVSCYLTWDDGTGVKFIAGRANEGYIAQQDVGTTDFGTAISAYWQTDLQDVGKPDCRKKMMRMVTGNDPGASPVDPVFVILGVDPTMRTAGTVTAETDQQLAVALTTVALEDEPLKSRYDFPDGCYADYFSAKVTHSDADRLMKLRYMRFEFIPQER